MIHHLYLKVEDNPIDGTQQGLYTWLGDDMPNVVRKKLDANGTEQKRLEKPAFSSRDVLVTVIYV